MNKSLIAIIFAFVLIMNVAQVSAGVEFWQQKFDMGNGTMKNHLYTQYNKETGGLVDNYVSGNNPLGVYLLYSVYPKKFNTDNPLYRISRCDFQINSWKHLNNQSTISYNQTFTELTDDTFNGKYYMLLYDGDGFTADMTCYFQNITINTLSLPAEMQLVTPSWECKSCQAYLWSITEKDILKAKSINENVVEVSGYIKKFFMLNFEIWLAMFWVFLILMLFTSIGLIFVMVYWLYFYIRFSILRK